MLKLSLGANEAEHFNAFIMPWPIYFIGYTDLKQYIQIIFEQSDYSGDHWIIKVR